MDFDNAPLADLDVLGSDATIRLATEDDAVGMVEVIRAAFSARPPVTPPAAALSETSVTIRKALSCGFGVVVERHGLIIGCLLVDETGDPALIERVCVHPDFHRQGIAQSMVDVTLDELALRSARSVLVHARKEFPEISAWWRDRGFVAEGETATTWTLIREVPWVLSVPTADEMRDLGRRLAQVLRAGDVIIATGELGAGKTTFTQGLGAGLGVAGPVVSPTFVLSRVHRALGPGPDLVHVDAYRLSGPAELDDIDLEASLADSVTLIEWGGGIAEYLSSDRLEIDIRRLADDLRIVTLTPVGARWQGVLGGVL